jgi:hypothetical protein
VSQQNKRAAAVVVAQVVIECCFDIAKRQVESLGSSQGIAYKAPDRGLAVEGSINLADRREPPALRSRSVSLGADIAQIEIVDHLP